MNTRWYCTYLASILPANADDPLDPSRPPSGVLLPIIRYPFQGSRSLAGFGHSTLLSAPNQWQNGKRYAMLGLPAQANSPEASLR